MSERLLSKRTAELMLLLFEDGVDGDELRALVDSAFSDGLSFMRRHYEVGGDADDS